MTDLRPALEFLQKAMQDPLPTSTSAYFAPKEELGVLGACLWGNADTATEAVALVRPDMFIDEDLKLTLELVETLARENKAASLENLNRQWKKAYGNLSAPVLRWNEAMESCPSAANLSYYADGVREAHQRRKLRDLATQIMEDSANPTVSLDVAMQHLEAGMVLGETATVEASNAKQAVVSFIDEMQARWQRKGELSGVPTGLPKLDDMLDGLQFGELTLVAARPSIGKTALGTSIAAVAAIEHLVPTLFVSCEMSTNAITRRLISCISEVPMQHIKTGQLSERDMSRLASAQVRLKDAPLHILDLSSGAKVCTITSAIRRHVRKHNVKLVIVDYLQKIGCSGKYEKRTYEVAEVSGTLKACAASTKVAMLALAQLNRESEKEKGRKPRLSDLADSGQIERDADTVLLLDRNRIEPKGEATIAIAKQRDGECGVVTCYYQGQFCRFEPALLQDL